MGEESHCVRDAKTSLTSDFLQDQIEEMLQDFYTTPQVKHIIPEMECLVQTCKKISWGSRLTFMLPALLQKVGKVQSYYPIKLTTLFSILLRCGSYFMPDFPQSSLTWSCLQRLCLSYLSHSIRPDLTNYKADTDIFHQSCIQKFTVEDQCVCEEVTEKAPRKFSQRLFENVLVIFSNTTGSVYTVK